MLETTKDIVSKLALDLGYRGQRRSSNWYRDFPDLIHVLGLQRSRWGGGNYLEGGIWLKAFGPDECPKYYECHVRLRLDEDCGLDLGEINSALKEDDFWKMDTEERMRILSEALRGAEADFFARARDLADLKEFLCGEHDLNLAVDKRVKEFFGIR